MSISPANILEAMDIFMLLVLYLCLLVCLSVSSWLAKTNKLFFWSIPWGSSDNIIQYWEIQLGGGLHFILPAAQSSSGFNSLT